MCLEHFSYIELGSRKVNQNYHHKDEELEH